jgi:ABC-2 type transport system permease protein
VLFFLMHTLTNVIKQIAGLRYFSLMTLFDPTEIIARGSSVMPSFATLLAIGLLLYAGGICVFSKKYLPL